MIVYPAILSTSLSRIKLLIGRGGEIVGRFGSRTAPDDKELVESVVRALKPQP